MNTTSICLHADLEGARDDFSRAASMHLAQLAAANRNNPESADNLQIP
jgi:hypothetical protein